VPAKWQIAQLCFPAGTHLPKRTRKMWEKWVEPYVDHYKKHSALGPKKSGYSFESYTRTFEADPPFGKWHTRLTTTARLMGNLDTDEYRFYVGHPGKYSNYAQCRVCLKVCECRQDRVLHNTASACRTKFVIAAKAVKVLGLCLVCNEITQRDKWGVPLCNPESAICEQLWMFEVCQPMALRHALLETFHTKGKR